MVSWKIDKHLDKVNSVGYYKRLGSQTYDLTFGLCPVSNHSPEHYYISLDTPSRIIFCELGLFYRPFN